MAVDETDRQPPCHPDPEIGCERGLADRGVAREPGLEHELHLDLAGCEDERAPHDVGSALGVRDPRARDQHHQTSHAATVALLVALAAGCKYDLREVDSIFYNGDGRKVHCGINLDDRASHTEFSVESSLDRAAERGEVVELYAHKPGITVPVERIESVIAGAVDRGLRFYTYRDFVTGVPIEAGIALAFDDSDVEGWFALRPLFQQYGARITFFITRYPEIGEAGHEQLRILHADGHDMAAHSRFHLRAPDYVEDNGLSAYLEDEVQPSIDLLVEEGYDVTSYAYPFGARTSELDEAILRRVSIVRSIDYAFDPVQAPCPH
jgi:hypothetical protein